VAAERLDARLSRHGGKGGAKRRSAASQGRRPTNCLCTEICALRDELAPQVPQPASLVGVRLVSTCPV
jgi:hypothetical protein